MTQSNTKLNPNSNLASDHVMSIMKDCIPIFTVLADENRHLILKLLLDNGKMNVNQLTDNLHLSRPAVSHHLKIMLSANAVSVEQIGKERFYAIAMKDKFERLGELVELMRLHCPSGQGG